MSKQTVTTHKRTMRNGTTVTVKQHKRTGPNPGHAWRSARRGWKHQRKGNSGRAAAWIVAAILEAVTYVLFKGVGVGLLTFALIAGGLATWLLKTSGKDQA